MLFQRGSRLKGSPLILLMCLGVVLFQRGSRLSLVHVGMCVSLGVVLFQRGSRLNFLVIQLEDMSRSSAVSEGI